MSEKGKKQKVDPADSASVSKPDELLPVSGDAAAAAYKRQAGPPDAERRPEEGEEVKQPAAPEAEPEAKIAELKDLLLRKAADFENYKKRIERERSEVTRFAAAGLVDDLLPVLDNFEHALKADEADGGDYRKGVEMIFRQLLDVLNRHGLEPIPSAGRQFDPEVHEAVYHEPVAGQEEGVVLEEIQRGYKLGGRVLRPAKVKVAAAPIEKEGGSGSTEIPIK